METVCMFCCQAHIPEGICGLQLQLPGLHAHRFCLLSANNLPRHPSQRPGWVTCWLEDVIRVLKEAAWKVCCVCGKSGAATTCWETGCQSSFHLPCATKGECILQYSPPFRAFCSEHRPKQVVQVPPEKGTHCLICLDKIDLRNTFYSLVCPTCQHAWFHRTCIQGQALCDGFSHFQCPHCRERDIFQLEMRRIGVLVPASLPDLDPEAYEELSARHRRCDTKQCLCPGGREQAEVEGPWQLLLCSSCAAEGTHRHCSFLGTSTPSWECQSCAGPSAASSTSAKNASPSGPSANRERPSGTSIPGPGVRSGSQTRHLGPMRVPACSRQPRQARRPYGRPGYRHRT